MINSNMTLFTILLIIAMFILIGNLFRLGSCTRVVLMRPLSSPERLKAYTLFLMYAIITSAFVYCGTMSLCSMWCPDIMHLHESHVLHFHLK